MNESGDAPGSADRGDAAHDHRLVHARPTDAAAALTHLSHAGEASMVDVTAKVATEREAVAEGALRCSADAYRLLESGANPKGDVEQVARIAGIMGGKRAGDLVPLCHVLPEAGVAVEVRREPALPGLRVTAAARANGRTGAEMEALTAVCVALLAAYDMLKAADRSMTIERVQLVRKSGGRSGDWTREDTARKGQD